MSKQYKKSQNNKERRPSGTLKPNKGLGQNFLIDEDVIDAIVCGSDISEESLVIEIGPGTGILTCPLAEQAGRVVAIELDERMIEPLRVKTFEYGNVEVINEDILQVDLNALIDSKLKEYGLKDVRVVGNLPYYITTPIIMKLLEMKTKADSITVMMQKEVGDRIVAKPGTKDSGPITYSVHYYSEVRKIVDAGRDCFYPAPKVDSVVLRMDILSGHPLEVKDEEFFFRCIKAGFSQRRKTLLNSMMTLGDYDKEQIERALTKANIETNRRAESLTMEEFAAFAEKLSEE